MSTSRKSRTPPFELIVTPFRNNEVKLTLYQWLVGGGQRAARSEQQPGTNDQGLKTKGRPPGPRRRRVVAFWGFPLAMAQGDILELLRENGHPPSAIAKRKKRRLALEEEQGVRLGLLFQTLKPLRKTERMDAMIEGVRRMSAEEAYYWYSKTANGAVNAEHRRALRALRILLAQE